jgi:hypothetical protein
MEDGSMAKNSWVLIGLVGVTSFSTGAAEVQLRSGETQILAVGQAQGIALDNPKIAEIKILNDSQVQVAAKENGEGTLSIFTADDKMTTYPIRVIGGAEASSPQAQQAGRWVFHSLYGYTWLPYGAEHTNELASERWSAALFGGKRIANARCAEPLENEEAATALQDARDLARQEHTEDAIRELNRALIIEPDAAVLHLYLASAWAKLKNQSRGASNYETFALSCPDDLKAKSVVRLLREFRRRTAHTKPES